MEVCVLGAGGLVLMHREEGVQPWHAGGRCELRTWNKVRTPEKKKVLSITIQTLVTSLTLIIPLST